jgi:hypothetical protein
MRAVVFLLGLVVLALVPAALPASATEAVTIETERQGFGSGTFSASGAIADAGTFTVQTPRGSPRNLITTETYVGDLGTFTLKRRISVTPTDDPNVRAVEGTWVMIDGTGAYAGLEGEGTVTGVIVGDGPTEKFFFTYTGEVDLD